MKGEEKEEVGAGWVWGGGGRDEGEGNEGGGRYINEAKSYGRGIDGVGGGDEYIYFVFVSAFSSIKSRLLNEVSLLWFEMYSCLFSTGRWGEGGWGGGGGGRNNFCCFLFEYQ